MYDTLERGTIEAIVRHRITMKPNGSEAERNV
jgi:hypothetical protein